MITHARHDRKFVRALTLGVALIAVGVLAPAAAGADGIALDSHQTGNERAIALIEGSDPANFPVAIADAGEFQPPTANARTIELTESKEAPGGVLAGIPAPPSRVAYEESEHAVAQNRDSVASQAPQSTSPNQAAF
jgi:hypothetical protein